MSADQAATAPDDTRAGLIAAKEDIVRRYGPWTAHNIRLADGVFTIGASVAGDEYKLRRVVQVVADLAGRPVEELRVLDLACLEGLYSIEFAARGARVVGVEGRSTNIEKARFAASALALENVEFVEDDVRNVSRDRFGEFDVVLCLGILYHLDAPDVFGFIDRIAELCTRLAVFDTHVGLAPREARVHRGRRFHGISFVEHSAAASAEERQRSLWASLDNHSSFWPTRPSLLNALAAAGFTTVAECRIPAQPRDRRDRPTFVAVKGNRHELATALNPPEADVPEQRLPRPVLDQSRAFQLGKRLVLDARARLARRR